MGEEARFLGALDEVFDAIIQAHGNTGAGGAKYRPNQPKSAWRSSACA
jgi:hypothetical protein